MSYRCEDYPCCGCGPEGCVDQSRIVRCRVCGKTYHPDPNTETTCYACQPDPEGDEWDQDNGFEEPDDENCYADELEDVHPDMIGDDQ